MPNNRLPISRRVSRDAVNGSRSAIGLAEERRATVREHDVSWGGSAGTKYESSRIFYGFSEQNPLGVAGPDQGRTKSKVLPGK